MHQNRNLIAALAAIVAVSLTVPAHAADSRPVAPPASALLSYADLADLADTAPLVIRAQPPSEAPILHPPQPSLNLAKVVLNADWHSPSTSRGLECGSQ